MKRILWGHRWIGRTVMAVAVAHTLFGLIVYHSTLVGLVADGVVNALGYDAMRAAVVWFLLAGFFMATTGIAIDQLEDQGLRSKLVPLGWGLLAITLLGIALMPASGFWLMLVPAYFCIRGGHGKAG